jgi:6-phosphogluconolactonase
MARRRLRGGFGVMVVSAVLGAAIPTVRAQDEAGAGPLRVYIGTYTRGTGSKGIYLADLDPASGSLKNLRPAGEAENPSFLAIHPNGKLLYAVSEVESFRESKGGAVVAFAINPDGTLTRKNAQPSGGAGPCHLIVDPAGKNVLVANYSGGSVAVLPLGADGSLKPPSQVVQHQGKGTDPRRQEGPHAHSINLDPSGKFALVADLGLDRVFVHRFDPEAGTLTPAETPFATVAPGSGPRHLVFAPDGKHVFVINEMASTVAPFAFDAATGRLTPAGEPVSTLPEVTVVGNSTAEVRIHPSGRFLYGSNRGHDSLAQFAVDAAGGRLKPLGHTPTRGRTPRNFNIEPSGRVLLVANGGTDRVIPFRISPETGGLTPVGDGLPVPSPVCIRFLPAAGR